MLTEEQVTKIREAYYAEKLKMRDIARPIIMWIFLERSLQEMLGLKIVSPKWIRNLSPELAVKPWE
jgi:hypothetical protein